MAKAGGHREGDVGQAAIWSDTTVRAVEKRPGSAQRSKVESIEPFFRSEYSRVWRWVQRLGVPRGEADDVAQEVFLVAFKKRPDELTRAWLYQVTRRVCSSYRRGRGRAAARSEGLVWVPPSATDAQQPAELAQRQRAQRFAALLERLPEAQREPFELVALEGMSATEVAELLGLPRNTVYTRLRRARARLQEWLEEEEKDD
jgi:RNA polymerase sigma-70 factor (ECF subfamily)